MRSSLKLYYNTVSPDYKVFVEGGAPQAGLYLVSYSPLTIIGSIFLENRAYAGIAIAFKGTIGMYGCQVTGHNIFGSSVIGTFLAMTQLTLFDMNLTNNTITTDTSLTNIQAALIVLITAKLQIDNLVITNGSSNDGAMLLFADVTSGYINNIKINNFYRNDAGQVCLIYLSSTQMTINNFESQNTTGLFKVIESRITMNSLTVKNVNNRYSSQFLMYMFDTTMNINALNYKGNGQTNALWPLFAGNKNSIKIMDCEFTDATEDRNKVFSLRSSKLLFVHNTIFTYSKDLTNTTIFDLTSSNSIIITNSVFQSPGTIIKANIILGGFYFTGNNIITDAHIQSITVTDVNTAYILGNRFLGQANQGFTASSESQIQVISSIVSTLSFKENTVLSLYGTNAILELYSQEYPYQANISKNAFINNLAVNGGAIYLSTENLPLDGSSSTAYIKDSIFIVNQAISLEEDVGKGGAIYQTTPDQSLQDTVIMNSYFVNNAASKIGGAIFFDYKPPTILNDAIFIENYATRLNHIGAYPTQLVYFEDNDFPNITYIPGQEVPKSNKNAKQYIWEDVASGVATEQVRRFLLLDMFDQVVYNDEASVLEIYPIGFTKDQRESFSTVLSIKAENGIYTMESFKFVYNVNDKLSVEFRSSAIVDSSVLGLEEVTTTPSLTIQVDFRSCKIGEFIAVSTDSTMCQECPSGFWQLKNNSAEYTCEACDSSSTICLGANEVGPKEGYWRLNETADLVLPCPREASCLGTEIEVENTVEGGESKTETIIPYPSGQCAPHYHGNLCNECTHGWAKSNGDQCVDCLANALPYFTLCAMILSKVALIIYGVYEIMHLGREFLENNIVETSSLVLFRIIITYSQTFSILSEISVKWPAAFEKIIKVIEKISVVSGSLISSDCVYNAVGESLDIEVVFLKAFFAAFSPLLFILAFMIFWIIYFKYKKRTIIGNENFTKSMIITIILICFDMQPEVLESGFSLLKCENLYRKDKPIEYLVEAYDVRCWEGSHLRWVLALAVPSLLVWVFLLPGIMFYILWKNRRNLRDDKIAKKYSFLYMGYKDGKFYWEFLITVRKILFVANAVFGASKSTNLEIFLSITILLIAHILHSMNHPYSSDDLNSIERKNLVSLTILVFCALYFQIGFESKFFTILVTIAGIAGNFYFLVFFFKFFISLQIQRMKQRKWIMTILKFIDKYFCFCIRLPKVQQTIEIASASIRRVSNAIQRNFSDNSKVKNTDDSRVKDDVSNKYVIQSIASTENLLLLSQPNSPTLEARHAGITVKSPLSFDNVEDSSPTRTGNNQRRFLVPIVKSRFSTHQNVPTLPGICEEGEITPFPQTRMSSIDSPSPGQTIFWGTKKDTDDGKTEDILRSKPYTESRVEMFSQSAARSTFLINTKKNIAESQTENMAKSAPTDEVRSEGFTGSVARSIFLANTKKDIEQNQVEDQMEDILKSIPMTLNSGDEGIHVAESLNFDTMKTVEEGKTENSLKSTILPGVQYEGASKNLKRSATLPEGHYKKGSKSLKRMGSLIGRSCVQEENEEEEEDGIIESILLPQIDDEEVSKSSVRNLNHNTKEGKDKDRAKDLKKSIKEFMEDNGE